MTALATPADAAGRPRNARLRRLFGHSVFNVVLVIIALFWLVPTVGLLVTSFRPPQDYFASGWWHALTTPLSLTLSNYSHILQNGNIPDALLTTALITVSSTILVVLIASLTGYAMVFLDWRGRDVVFVLVVALMVVPLQMALIPVSSLYRSVGLFATLPGVVLFHVAFGLPFAIFLMRNFYTGIPKDLLEAARIDGANEWMMFRRIVLPLGKPALASLAIFQFLWVWNDLLVSLSFLASNPHQPITVAIFSQLRQFGANIDVISTASFVSMIIPLAVFFAFQRYFVRGVLAGAVK
ncbi:MAG: carbohydrate ABC transporter permease [Candidatus Dormibacteraeota bacterium]|uniref:Carbohydrate ABC transporter permease n=1 Tax=Candidatus Aeolococcus gillhamiae TaxID=3127015 RepID=A0A2W5Z2Q3_9BACT|nr:carbohydrate ABC transporter permease [Candidatus Dormibacteraeota bacterium]PZR78417.1 MAG: sugar ABC transporter permease [Candidatus Dormibacter sp. RRmetagenome_bin12]